MIVSREQIGARLRAARKRSGLRLVMIAESLHCDRSNLGHWERGRSEPNYTMLQRMCSLYGIEVADLFKQEAA
jgi:transcriptional regulator with XRE-family HTH domain